ncbi:major facilitator superfamily domain-containing protein 8-like [Amphibalanus amphitrite]|uniref:major facilitator superfamily domain-containing protein 8-like n=1 Tax=Amphibalanus amphitrite TaxID=1232801 RepID=UPI001C910B1A|nr:major facilitator superfamily domain-containing protein 8-like [Amphibalanus amphitrite]
MNLLGGRSESGGGGVIYDTMHLETLEERRRRHVSFWLVCIRTSCAYIALSMIVPTTWPYMQNLDPAARKTDAAWIISGMFIARIANNALLGPVLRLMSLRTLALLTSVMVMASYVMWALAYLVPSHPFYLLAASRAIDGLFGSDTVIGSVFVTRGTTSKERGPAMALLAGAAAAAYIPGAGATTLLSLLGPEGVTVGGYRFNMYTVAGITAFSVFLVTTVLLYFFFFDNEIAYQELELGLGGGGGGLGRRRADGVRSNYVGIATCIMVMCSVGCILLFNDSLLVPMFMDMNGWPEERAVRTYGFLMMGFSLVSTTMFVVTAKLANRFGERSLLLAGSVVGFLGFFVSLPWGSEMPPTVAPLPDTIGTNATEALSGAAVMANTTESAQVPLGCPPEQSWCATVPRIYLSQYVTELVLHGIAVALLASMCNALFSKCLSPGSEGFWWGLMKAMANISRLVTPVAFSYLYQYAGPRAMYGTLSSLMAAVLTVTLVSYRRLVSAPGRKDEETPLLAESRSRQVSGSETPCMARSSEYGSSDPPEHLQLSSDCGGSDPPEQLEYHSAGRADQPPEAEIESDDEQTLINSHGR